MLHSYIESVESKPKSGSSECKNEPSLGEEKTLKVDRLIIKGPAIYLMKKTPGNEPASYKVQFFPRLNH